MMKAYEYTPALDRELKRDAEYYQETASQWHDVLQYDVVYNTVYELDTRTKQYSRARYKMGLREADYDWESHAG